jgi:predicted transposase/invertase (TIGR01784 family)
MLHFLNTVLADDLKDTIVELHYDNTERLGITDNDRKAIYDLICTTGKGECIIIEMQAVWQEFFKDRILSYVSALIQDQNKKGKDWDFELPSIYSINLLNFTFDRTGASWEKYSSYVQLIDRDTHQLFYDKLTFVYIELPRFTKELTELKNFFEQWMFLIRRLHELDEIPKAFRNEVFEKLFEEAKIARMTKKEKDNYYTSLKNLRNMNIAKIELAKKDKIIASMGNELKVLGKDLKVMGKDLKVKDKTIAAKDKALTAMEKMLAEYQRRFGVLPDNN